MKHINEPRSNRAAFTLIELLVVIAIIAILAALLFPVGAKIMQNAAKKRAQAELTVVATAIDSYHAKLGFYPPDNPNPAAPPYMTPLYFELVGCTNVTSGNVVSEFVSRDRGIAVTPTILSNSCNVTRILNSSRIQAADDEVGVQTFLKEIKANQLGGAGALPVLGVQIDGPVMAGQINPFRYVSSNPVHNVNSYDLWVDILVGGKTNRISNWSDTPEVL